MARVELSELFYKLIRESFDLKKGEVLDFSEEEKKMFNAILEEEIKYYKKSKNVNYMMANSSSSRITSYFKLISNYISQERLKYRSLAVDQMIKNGSKDDQVIHVSLAAKALACSERKIRDSAVFLENGIDLPVLTGQKMKTKYALNEFLYWVSKKHPEKLFDAINYLTDHGFDCELFKEKRKYWYGHK